MSATHFEDGVGAMHVELLVGGLEVLDEILDHALGANGESIARLRGALLQRADHRNAHALVRTLDERGEERYDARASHLVLVLLALAQAPQGERATAGHLDVLVELDLAVRVRMIGAHAVEQRHQLLDAVVLTHYFARSLELGHVGDRLGRQALEILVRLGEYLDHRLQTSQIGYRAPNVRIL